MPPQRGSYWCFTVNNYTDDEEKNLLKCCRDNADVEYIIFGREVGNQGTKHLQGYLELKRKLRLGGVKRISGLARAHLELRRGTQSQAITYCKKDNDFFEEGTPKTSSQGKRNDLTEIKKLIDSGHDEASIADTHFGQWCRYRKSFRAYKSLKFSKEQRDVTVRVLYGVPGTGKTRFVFEYAKSRGVDLFIANDPTLQWFDGYNGEPVVCLDDYRGEANGAFLLRLLDRYPLQVPIKGSYVPFLATEIWITSNMEPPFNHIDITQALGRRIKQVCKLNVPLLFGDVPEGNTQPTYDELVNSLQ